MSLEELSDREREIVLQSLSAILRGGFLEGEFHTRLGLEPEELEEIVSAYPNVDDRNHDSKVFIAINNCLNEVCHGISFSSDQWSRWFEVNRSEVKDVFRKWRTLGGYSDPEI